MRAFSLYNCFAHYLYGYVNLPPYLQDKVKGEVRTQIDPNTYSLDRLKQVQKYNIWLSYEALKVDVFKGIQKMQI